MLSFTRFALFFFILKNHFHFESKLSRHTPKINKTRAVHDTATHMVPWWCRRDGCSSRPFVWPLAGCSDLAHARNPFRGALGWWRATRAEDATPAPPCGTRWHGASGRSVTSTPKSGPAGRQARVDRQAHTAGGHVSAAPTSCCSGGGGAPAVACVRRLRSPCGRVT